MFIKNNIRRLTQVFTPRAVKLSIVISMLSLLGACSAIQLAYNNAVPLVMYQINSYLDLDSAQEMLIRERIKKLHAWHRTSQLPLYASFLRGSQQSLFSSAPVSALQVSQMTEQITGFTQGMLERSIPDMADLTMILNEKNFIALEKKHAENKDKFRKDWLNLNLEKLQEKRQEKLVERFEFWFGKPNATQKLQLNEMSDKTPIDITAWDAESQDRHIRFMAVLRDIKSKKYTKPAVEQKLRSYFAESQIGFTEQSRANVVKARALVELTTLQILKMATPAQKAKARNKVNEIATDFTELASVTDAVSQPLLNLN